VNVVKKATFWRTAGYSVIIMIVILSGIYIYWVNETKQSLTKRDEHIVSLSEQLNNSQKSLGATKDALHKSKIDVQKIQHDLSDKQKLIDNLTLKLRLEKTSDIKKLSDYSYDQLFSVWQSRETLLRGRGEGENISPESILP